jgi:hypothetical protein
MIFTVSTVAIDVRELEMFSPRMSSYSKSWVFVLCYWLHTHLCACLSLTDKLIMGHKQSLTKWNSHLFQILASPLGIEVLSGL